MSSPTWPEHPLGRFQPKRIRRGGKPLVAPSYRGGRTFVDGPGYVHEYAPDHPHANGRGFVKQHRLVMEGVVGRLLEAHEEVHHEHRAEKANNDPSNLRLCASNAEHRKLHGADQLIPLDQDDVRRAVASSASMAEAARLLGVDQQTIRNRFPDLVKLTRRPPNGRYDDAFLARVRSLASDPDVSTRHAVKVLRCSPWMIRLACRQMGIAWVAVPSGRPSRRG